MNPNFCFQQAFDASSSQDIVAWKFKEYSYKIIAITSFTDLMMKNLYQYW